MKEKYREYKQLNLPEIGQEIQEYWREHGIFHKSMDQRKNHEPFIFYEGPPSANGLPGIHHVMARAIKDIFCRYKTMKGFYVKRKAGWDTHGLPIEIAVEKTLGITKEDIGKKISVEDFNAACRREVMRYKNHWDDITLKIGYWVDLDDPYITFENKYIETVWYLLARLFEKGLLYKGYSIQPYSPAAGTGISNHELNQPGAYRDVKDNTVTAQFRLIRDPKSEFLFARAHGEVFILAWTTTAWTLPSNTALAVGRHIDYVLVNTFNPYTSRPVTVILAKDLFNNFFPEKNAGMKMNEYEPGQKNIPFEIIQSCKGEELIGIRYEQLLPYAQPEDGDAFRVIPGDFVTTEDGTGIVHIAPSFGADDFRAGKENGIGSLTMVDKQGKFVDAMGEFAGRFVKNEYYPDYDPEKPEYQDSVDVDIIVKLKRENKAFKTEKYVHSYPHCWRTDKPILYYPLDAWFIRSTAYRDQMIALNNTINWKPKATGEGRFGNWLENLVDWNLSRSRFWGTPLPIWMTEDGKEKICIGSVAQLKEEVEKAVRADYMSSNPFENYSPGDVSEENYHSFDLHRPFVDHIILVSPSGRKMYREPDLIDVWFDSGAMPYAQYHYPFEPSQKLEEYFPADFIAEGVDQTRGWFFTLHAIAVMLFDSVSYRTCVSNGLILDKNGNKMSKKLGNTVSPFEMVDRYGPDALRWYLLTNAQPWDNLKFDVEGMAEAQRKFFGTFYNTYAFFALYANIDGFDNTAPEVPVSKRPEIDRWILSELHTLIQYTDECYHDYEPTKAGRAIQDFVVDHLSNWYVRLSRRRFWKGDMTDDKIAAYQTLYTCLVTAAQLAAPLAPFFTERIFTDLNRVTGQSEAESVHLTDFPVAMETLIDKDLEQRMELAQDISSMVLSLRKRSMIRVRQPLNKVMVPVLTPQFREQMDAVRNLILTEVNVKDIQYISDTSDILVKKIKPNFKTLGPRYGKLMKQIAATIDQFDQQAINRLEQNGSVLFNLDGQPVEILISDVEILTEDIPGWVVSNMGNLTVALDLTITDELRQEGLARELINRIQNLRKESNLEVTDKIRVEVEKNQELETAIQNNYHYICSETLAISLKTPEIIASPNKQRIEITEEIQVDICIEKAG
ncbi:MAG TPA: isoleucine--tRNA ligase [Bacteroidales bacterium]|nr:isoleucine--tRNA ligase [Bacteroidales bacterium]HRZ20050.1 isoleucine--tRNA ligase [Bacteroidales bacterium]